MTWFLFLASFCYPGHWWAIINVHNKCIRWMEQHLIIENKIIIGKKTSMKIKCLLLLEFIEMHIYWHLFILFIRYLLLCVNSTKKMLLPTRQMDDKTIQIHTTDTAVNLQLIVYIKNTIGKTVRKYRVPNVDFSHIVAKWQFCIFFKSNEDVHSIHSSHYLHSNFSINWKTQLPQCSLNCITCSK